MARQIDYYFSTVSPWAYIGHALFEDVAKANDLKVNYKPVTLGEVFAETGGLPLSKRHPARQRYRMLELKRWREKRGLQFHLEPKNWPFNSRIPDGVILAALEAGLNPEPFIRRVFKGSWEDQLNLSDAATITKVADESGLPGAKLVTRAASDDIGAIYNKNRDDAVAAGVFGSPAWVLDGEVFWGQDRIELLVDALKSGRKAYTPDA